MAVQEKSELESRVFATKWLQATSVEDEPEKYQGGKPLCKVNIKCLGFQSVPRTFRKRYGGKAKPTELVLIFTCLDFL